MIAGFKPLQSFSCSGHDHVAAIDPGTRDAVLAAFHGGADGVILSRKYSEMKLGNLAGAGDAIKALGFA